MRRTLVRLRLHAILAIRLFEAREQQPAQGAQLIKLPALFIDLLVQALYRVFQTDEFELYFYKTLFHCAVRLWIHTTLGKRKDGDSRSYRKGLPRI